jgi:hypothetical protein
MTDTWTSSVLAVNRGILFWPTPIKFVASAKSITARHLFGKALFVSFKGTCSGMKLSGVGELSGTSVQPNAINTGFNPAVK